MNTFNYAKCAKADQFKYNVIFNINKFNVLHKI